MEKKTVSVVTGGAGFIGSHLCDRLIGMGHMVICVDNLITGLEENIGHLKSHPHFRFVRHNVIEELPDLGSIDAIYHLASPASVVDYQKFPEETALVNSVGTRNLLQAAAKAHATFLFASTSEIYGDPKEHPQKETYWGNVNPNGVRSCYDEAKRFGEMMTMLNVRKRGVDARIIRIFNTYGPRMRKTDGRVVSNFINQALAGVPLTVYGDGTQTRSFCFVSDLVSGIVSAMTSTDTRAEVFNLGNPEEYRMIDLANKIIAFINPSLTVSFGDLPQDDPKERRPDISKAKAKLGWSPEVSVDEGLKETIAYYRSLNSK